MSSEFSVGDRVALSDTDYHGTVCDIGLDGSVYVDWDDPEGPVASQGDGEALVYLEQETLDRELGSALDSLTRSFNHLRELGYYVWWDELSFFVGVRDGDDAFYVNRDTQYNWDWEQR